MWFFELLYKSRGKVCSNLYDNDFLYLIFAFRGILWQPSYHLLIKKLKDLCFSADKNIAHLT